MATLEQFKITPFWDDAYRFLDYAVEEFNNPLDTAQWLAQGYSPKFTGAMCDMRKAQPVWNDQIVAYFQQLGWRDIGTSYYRMDTGTVLPVHQDTYRRYVDVFNLAGRETSVRRAVVFLEDWASGHYLEINNNPLVHWAAGDVAVWSYDTPHMAANMGLTPRYTLQVTGNIL